MVIFNPRFEQRAEILERGGKFSRSEHESDPLGEALGGEDVFDDGVAVDGGDEGEQDAGGGEEGEDLGGEVRVAGGKVDP